jgi:aminopeptidase N
MRILYVLFLTALLFSYPTSSKAQLFQPKYIFSRADSLRGSLTPLRTCYDLTYYHLDVKFDIKNKFISGSNQFNFTATSDFSKLQFDLFQNLTVENVIYHGKAVSFTREGNAVFVNFPKVISKGAEDAFSVFYSGHPTIAQKAPWEGGVVFSKDSLNNDFVATACESVGASIWWPNKDHLADEVDSMLISISVPNGLKDVSNGQLRKVIDLKNGYTQFDWFVSNPINNYCVAANIGKYSNFSDVYAGVKGNLSLNYWVLTYNLEKAKKQFDENVKPMLRSNEEWFGPYPFYKDGYKLVETPYPAMEHQSAISYGGFFVKAPHSNDLRVFEGGKIYDFIIVHESGHEWFGNSITAKDMADLWIHEAFTTYSQALFAESLYGKKVAQKYIYDTRSGISNQRSLVGPYGVNKEGSSDMYNKGAVLLNMVRSIVNNDQQWRRILLGLNKTFFHQTVTYDQITTYISTQAGVDLSPVFDQYLHYTKIPVLELAIKKGKLFCRWQADAKNFNMPVQVHLGKGAYQVIKPTTVFKPVEIKGPTLKNLTVDTANFYIQVRKV